MLNKNVKEHSVWLCKNGEEVEICIIGETQCVVEISFNGETHMETVSKEYLENAILKSRLVPKPIEKYLIRRKEDNKYYQGKGRWIDADQYAFAAKFKAESIAETKKVFTDKGYNVELIPA